MAAELKQMEVRLCLKEAPGVYSEDSIKNAEGAVRIMSEVMKDLDREHCCVVNMDTRGYPINYNIVSIGGLRSAERKIRCVQCVYRVLKPAYTLRFWSFRIGLRHQFKYLSRGRAAW